MTRNTGRHDDENLGSFYMGRTKPAAPPRRVLPRGMLTLISLAAFIAIIWYAYPEGQEKYDPKNIPVITADKTPYKSKPDDPGGIEVLHQDSTVFDPLEGKSDDNVEKLMPQPEQPVDKTEAVQEKALLETKEPQLNLDLQMKEVGDGTEKVISKKEEARKAAEAAKKADKKADKAADKPTVKEAAKEQAKEPAKPAVKETKAAAASKTPDRPTGDVFIRLGSYRSVDGAKEDWDKLRNQYPQYFKGLGVRTQRIDLGVKGVFNRLEVGTFTEKRAKDICAVLAKTNPGGCLIVR